MKEHVVVILKTTPSLKMAAKLEELEDRLESFIENLRAVGVTAGNFQQNGQAVLNERL